MFKVLGLCVTLKGACVSVCHPSRLSTRCVFCFATATYTRFSQSPRLLGPRAAALAADAIVPDLEAFLLWDLA